MTKLELMLKYVSEHNDFYKKIIKEHGITNPLDITQYPIITRQMLQENRYNMFSDGYQSRYFSQQLHRQASSGTSGVPIDVYWDSKDYYASMRVLWRKRLAYYDVHPFERYVKFTANITNGDSMDNDISYLKESDNILNINISTVRNEMDYKRMIDLIGEFNPKWLYIQPFILRKLIEYDLKHSVC